MYVFEICYQGLTAPVTCDDQRRLMKIRSNADQVFQFCLSPFVTMTDAVRVQSANGAQMQYGWSIPAQDIDTPISL
jgi:hypothetical protein